MDIRISMLLLSLGYLGYCINSDPEPVSELDLDKLAGRWYNVSPIYILEIYNCNILNVNVYKFYKLIINFTHACKVQTTIPQYPSNRIIESSRCGEVCSLCTKYAWSQRVILLHKKQQIVYVTLVSGHKQSQIEPSEDLHVHLSEFFSCSKRI